MLKNKKFVKVTGDNGWTEWFWEEIIPPIDTKPPSDYLNGLHEGREFIDAHKPTGD